MFAVLTDLTFPVRLRSFSGCPAYPPSYLLKDSGTMCRFGSSEFAHFLTVVSLPIISSFQMVAFISANECAVVLEETARLFLQRAEGFRDAVEHISLVIFRLYVHVFIFCLTHHLFWPEGARNSAISRFVASGAAFAEGQFLFACFS